MGKPRLSYMNLVLELKSIYQNVSSPKSVILSTTVNPTSLWTPFKPNRKHPATLINSTGKPAVQPTIINTPSMSHKIFANYHQLSHFCIETKNPNSTTTPARQIKTKRVWKSTSSSRCHYWSNAAEISHRQSLHAASRSSKFRHQPPRFDLQVLISTFERRHYPLPMSSCYLCFEEPSEAFVTVLSEVSSFSVYSELLSLVLMF